MRRNVGKRKDFDEQIQGGLAIQCFVCGNIAMRHGTILYASTYISVP